MDYVQHGAHSQGNHDQSQRADRRARAGCARAVSAPLWTSYRWLRRHGDLPGDVVVVVAINWSWCCVDIVVAAAAVSVLLKWRLSACCGLDGQAC